MATSTALFALEIYDRIPAAYLRGELDISRQDGGERSEALQEVLREHRRAVVSGRAPEDIQAMELRGRLIIEDLELPVRVRSMRPNMTRSEIEMPNGIAAQAFDGIAGWVHEPGEDARWLNQYETASIRRDARVFSYLMAGPDEPVVLELVEQTPDAIDLKATTEFGNIVQYRLDPETFLITRETKTDYEQGRFRIKNIQLEDYREVDGVQIPFRVKHFMYGQQQMELVVDEVSFPDGFSRIIFEAPLAETPRGYQEALKSRAKP